MQRWTASAFVLGCAIIVLTSAAPAGAGSVSACAPADAACATVQQLDDGAACGDADQGAGSHTLFGEAYGAAGSVFVQWYCADEAGDDYQRRFIVVSYDSGLGLGASVFWHSEENAGKTPCTTDVAVGGVIGQDLGCPAGVPPTYALPGVLP